MKSLCFKICLVCVLSVGAVAAQAAITAHYTFDDAGNGGLNMLKASIGSDAVVRGGVPAADVNGLGALYPTNGLGGGALAIPVGQFLAIPHGLTRSTGQAWFLRMRIFIPDSQQHALLQFDQTNKHDAYLFHRWTGEFGGSANWGSYKTYSPGAVGVWRTLLLSCDGTATTLYVDGTRVHVTKDGATYGGGSDLTDVEYFYVSADNTGEDHLILVDDILVGSGSYDDQIVAIPSAGSASYDGNAHRSALVSTNDYAVTSSAEGTARGFYPVTVSLVDPVTKTWDDGTTSDKTVYFAIRDALVPEVTEHLAFDDPADLLKATVGGDAGVREGNPSTAVEGLGNVTSVSGEGRTDGTGAAAIPMGQFLAMPHGLAATAGTRWQIDFRCRVPSNETYHTLFSVGTNNTEDAALHIHNNTGLGNNTGWGGYVYDVLPFQKWNTVSVRYDDSIVSCWANGAWVANAVKNHLKNFALNANFSLSSDNKGEDGLMEFDDVKVYRQKTVVRTVPPPHAGLFVYTGEPVSATLGTADGYALRDAFVRTEPGVYQVPVGLLDPTYAVWTDTGFSGDRTVTFAISREANAWTTEPSVGATRYLETDLPPAFNPGAAAHGQVTVLLDGVPLTGELSTTPGTHTLTFFVEPTVDFAGLSKAFQLTVLPAGSAVPTEITAAAYVTNSLFMLLDGIENAGIESHDETSAVWKDLSGNGYDWLLAKGGSFGSAGLSLDGSYIAATNASACRPDFVSHLGMIEFVWQNGRNAHGIIFGPGFTQSAYLYTDSANHVGVYGGNNGTATTVGVRATQGESVAYSAAYVVSSGKPTGVADLWTNGVLAATENLNNYWNSAMGKYPSIGAQAPDDYPRAKGLLSCLRVYSDSLTADERALNSAIDTLRFGSGAMPASIGLDGYKIEDGAIFVRVSVSSVAGKTSLNGRPYGYSDSAYVPLGSSVTIDGKFRGAGVEDASKFVRTGVPNGAVVSADGKRFTFRANAPSTMTVTHPDAADGFILFFR